MEHNNTPLINAAILIAAQRVTLERTPKRPLNGPLAHKEKTMYDIYLQDYCAEHNLAVLPCLKINF